jgi:hypothetical protein
MISSDVSIIKPTVLSNTIVCIIIVNPSALEYFDAPSSSTILLLHHHSQPPSSTTIILVIVNHHA